MGSLTVDYTPDSAEKFPKNWRNRPLQFNVPFSVVIFTDLFYEKYTNYLKDGGEVEENALRPFVIDYLNQWIKERGAGHYKFINEIMFTLFSNSLTSISEDSKPQVIETQITMDYIVNYIVDVLVHFTRFRDDGTLNLRESLDNIFIQIVDIWGLISVYYPFLEMLRPRNPRGQQPAPGDPCPCSLEYRSHAIGSEACLFTGSGQTSTRPGCRAITYSPSNLQPSTHNCSGEITMMIIMKTNATPQQVEAVIASVKSAGLNVHLSQGVEATIIGAIGETHSIPLDRFESLDGVDVVQRITQPYKLASRQFHSENTILPVDGFTVGGEEIAIIAGPCGSGFLLGRPSRPGAPGSSQRHSCQSPRIQR